ncbi:single-stranded DNA-binding protein [Filimonas effusa]|uniref:Single-stranded DNA-binding protein n=1 Tax=Filimonas effusa TaxID=2508721 RepID=A0A4Q1DCC7_9BACT|nr:single-stranded DNA-binding protein [Filimonas effusa]RXK87010.1 single-stranded DNA-binding protein [Filimonas effusa]
METKVVANITADAIVNVLEGGKSVVNFDVAINDYFRKKGAKENTKVTTYVRCAYWNHTGIAPYLKKGVLVEITGRVGTQAYSSKDGTAKAALTLTVQNIKLHGKPANSTKNEAETAPANITEPIDDLPF